MAATVKVRVFVAVDPTGNWNATGWPGMKGPLDADLHEGLQLGETYYELTADLPVPARSTEVPALIRLVEDDAA